MASTWRTRPAGRPVGSVGTETRARILRSAREIFAQAGYERATPAAVAEAAGLGRTAIYNYFGSKADLYQAVIEDVNASVMEELFGETTEPPVERVKSMLRESARRNASDPSYGRFLSTMLVDSFRYPEFAAHAEAEVERTRTFFAEALEQASPGRAQRELLDLLVAMQWGLGLFAAFMGDPERVRGMTEQLINLIDRLIADFPLIRVSYFPRIN